MSRPRIFVSHSSSNNPITSDICDGLAPNQERANCEILVDFQRLEAGQEWDTQLHEWMGRCHAALIVLTTSAAKSPWVLKESTILLQRNALEANFPVFVARLGDVTDELLEANRWNPLSLGRIHRLSATAAPEIAAEILHLTRDLSVSRTPFDRMVGVLAGLLRNVETGELETVTDKLTDFDPPPWSSSVDEKQRHVETIARHLMCGNLGDYATEGLEGLIGDIGWTPDAKTLRSVVRALGPHWVDAHAVAPLAILPALKERRAVAINGEFVDDGSEFYTVKQFIHRAHLADANKYKIWSVAGANSGDLLKHYTKQICDRARKLFRGLSADSTQDEIIDRLAGSKQATFYLVLPEVPPGDVLQSLLNLFPKLNFIAGTGPTLNVNPELTLVDWLDPPLDLEIELHWFDDWDKALQTIDELEK